MTPTPIGRRTAIAGAASLSLTGVAAQPAFADPRALPVPSGELITFQMRRKGDVIGSHVLSFAQQSNHLVVSVAIDIVVRLLSIPVYRYSHRATERWESGRFMGIESRTDRDGTALTMRAARGPEGMVVDGSSSGHYVAPEGVLPSTYWNRALLTGRIINSEDGDLMKVPYTDLGQDKVAVANGQMVAATHYRLAGELPLDLWYDADNQWAGLVFSKGGTPIIYEKL